MSFFRTTEISNPAFEDRLRFLTVKSNNLKGRGDICTFVPFGNTETNLPIVILLHGVYGSSWSWALSGGAHITAQRLMDSGAIKPMILAMPSDGLWGDGSAFTKHSGYDFEKWIVEDVLKAVKELIPQAQNSTKTFISGLSMGGFGALRIGAKYGTKISAISAHSAITEMEQMKLFVEEDFKQYSATDQVDHSVFQTILKYKATLPPLRFDCGNEDLLINFNRRLSSELKRKKIPHAFEEFAGKHEWAYWQKHLEESLLFFNSK